MKIEEYGFIGDMHTGALVGLNGSIEWLCLPRFDSTACFAALLGSEKNGYWQISPTDGIEQVEQQYRPDTLILETHFHCPGGVARVVDFMPPGDHRHDVVRIVEGLSGRISMEMKLVLRFDYGLTVPWVTRGDGGIRAIAGPNAVIIRSDVELKGEDLATCARFELSEGERRFFVLTSYPSHHDAPPPLDPQPSLVATEQFWRDWVSQCTYQGQWRSAVVRSLITLKALTYQPTGGIVAAPTTSLPEKIGGVRNWDYRYCWLRDATFTLYAMMGAGYTDEATRWTEWLLRAVAGDPAQLQILYCAAGERMVPEIELKHLSGYEASVPVRIGNAASEQLQLDVYGEIVDANHLKRQMGLQPSEESWHMERHLIEFVAKNWDQPDEGIWEIRGPRRHFTHSKVMAWVALDRAVKAVENFGLPGDVERWRTTRSEIHADVSAQAYRSQRGVFTQYYGSDQLDASLLMMPLVGFLPIKDPRVVRTVRAIQKELTVDGIVHRYEPAHSTGVDGLPPGEGAFLPCSFWLVDCLFLLGEQEEAEALFERLLTLRSSLGLLSEEYDLTSRRLLGNFPQAFSHVALLNSAHNLSTPRAPGRKHCSSSRAAT